MRVQRCDQALGKLGDHACGGVARACCAWVRSWVSTHKMSCALGGSEAHCSCGVRAAGRTATAALAVGLVVLEVLDGHRAKMRMLLEATRLVVTKFAATGARLALICSGRVVVIDSACRVDGVS